ncbi:MAG: hypothetical protein ABSB22_24090 [Thermodesulfobacteriota bacterium]
MLGIMGVVAVFKLESPTRLAEKRVCVEPVREHRKTVSPVLPNIHRTGKGIMKTTGVAGWRIGPESFGDGRKCYHSGTEVKK